MGKVLGLDGQPIVKGTGKPAWNERTKKELDLMDDASLLIQERLEMFFQTLADQELEEEDKKQKLSDLEKATEQDVARYNARFIQLNQSHPGYKHGRETTQMIPNIFELQVNRALSLRQPREEVSNG